VVDLHQPHETVDTLTGLPPRQVARPGVGYSLSTNQPPRVGGGLRTRVDKFDASAVRNYLETYLGMYSDAAGPDLIGKARGACASHGQHRVGAANWNAPVIEQSSGCGYDPTQYLPALTGTIVGSTRCERCLPL